MFTKRVEAASGRRSTQGIGSDVGLAGKEESNLPPAQLELSKGCHLEFYS